MNNIMNNALIVMNNALIVVFIVLVIIGALFVGVYILNRSDKQKRDHTESEMLASHQRVTNYMIAELDRREARIDELSKLSWNELRKMCESCENHGVTDQIPNPCTCATKREIGRNVCVSERYARDQAIKQTA